MEKTPSCTIQPPVEEDLSAASAARSGGDDRSVGDRSAAARSANRCAAALSGAAGRCCWSACACGGAGLGCSCHESPGGLAAVAEFCAGGGVEVPALGEPSVGESGSVDCAAAGDSVMGVGCAGPLACAEALDVPADVLAPCESSARFIVYERNGGSSEEETAACGAGADREGPLSSSGTNNTISTTRMIAPVSRSFTRLSKIGSEPVQSSATAFSISQATASPAPPCGTSRTPARDPLAWP
jgi:hypothetical protein